MIQMLDDDKDIETPSRPHSRQQKEARYNIKENRTGHAQMLNDGTSHMVAVDEWRPRASL